jgi:RNA polymerase sigma factor (sigma-70 family)
MSKKPQSQRSTNHDELSMIAAIRHGDRGLFHDLIRPYENSAYMMAFDLLRDEAEAEDAVLNAFVRAFRDLGTFRMESSFSIWLKSILLNEVITQIRKKRSTSSQTIQRGWRKTVEQVPHQGHTRSPNILLGTEKESRSGASAVSVVRRRILCVDDDQVGSRLCGKILEEEGYSVVLRHCPLEALRCDFSRVDLAILDFELPHMNGHKLLLEMRARGARFPIILLSGSTAFLRADERVLFSECVDKAQPIYDLFAVIFRFLNPDAMPDFTG